MKLVKRLITIFLFSVCLLSCQDAPNNDVQEVLVWVHRNIKYVSDKDVYGVADYWQTPQVTMELKQGDCEDMVILAMDLLWQKGWHSELCAGVTHNGTGHAFLRSNGKYYSPTPIHGQWEITHVYSYHQALTMANLHYRRYE